MRNSCANLGTGKVILRTALISKYPTAQVSKIFLRGQGEARQCQPMEPINDAEAVK